METKNNICDVCGYANHFVGVYTSALGAMSFGFCGICLSMRAEPKWMVDSTIDLCGGLDRVNEDANLTYYEKETDRYKDVREGYFPIKIKSGQQFRTRAAMVKHLAMKYPGYVPKITVEE